MSQTHMASPDAAPRGIGGWLILPLLGLLLTPVQGFFQLPQYAGLGNAWRTMNPAQTDFLVCEIAANAIIVFILPPALLVLLLSRRHGFPRFYVAWAVADLLLVIADLALARVLFADVYAHGSAPFFDADTVRNITRSLLTVLIWVPYMLLSRRVRNTFVN